MLANHASEMNHMLTQTPEIGDVQFSELVQHGVELQCKCMHKLACCVLNQKVALHLMTSVPINRSD